MYLLDRRRNVFPFLCSLSRLTGVPVDMLLVRGETIKSFAKLLLKGRGRKLLLPCRPVYVRCALWPARASHVLRSKAPLPEGGYTGGHVETPLKGLYTDPIFTIDYNSLYPSIMIAHNLCYTTLVSMTDARRLDGATWHTAPINEKHTSTDRFLNTETYRGIVPEILDEYLEARAAARKVQKAAQKRADAIQARVAGGEPLAPELQTMLTDALNEVDVYEGEQRARKVCANALYGYTGAALGQLLCLPICSSVTAYARDAIVLAKAQLEREMTPANYPDLPEPVTVIYGDTDSLMVRTRVMDLTRVIELAYEACRLINSTVPAPMKIDFEKVRRWPLVGVAALMRPQVYWPYLLINKKKYAGALWKADTPMPAYIDVKGIETVRRDFCPLVTHTLEVILDTLLYNPKYIIARGPAAGWRAGAIDWSADLPPLHDMDSETEEVPPPAAPPLVPLEAQPPMAKLRPFLEKAALSRVAAIVTGFVRRTVQAVYDGRVSTHFLIRSSRVNDGHYKCEATKPAHALFADIQRAAGVDIPMGSRVTWIHVRRGTALAESLEDPYTAIRQGMRPDPAYYVENQLKRPVLRIMRWAMRNPEAVLFHGVRKTAVASQRPKGSGRGLLKFKRLTRRCVDCKGTLTGAGDLCRACLSAPDQRAGDLCGEIEDMGARLSKMMGRCYACCSVPTGTAIMCNNIDCKRLWRRHSVTCRRDRAVVKLQAYKGVRT